MHIVDEDIQYKQKCKYFNFCEYVQPDGYTCNHQTEAMFYCGKYRKLNDNIKKGWGP